MERFRFNDFDACASALLSWEIEAIQLDRGLFEAELVQAGSRDALVSEITFGRALHQRGEPPRGLRTVGIPADPTQRIFFRDHWTHANQLMFFPHGSEMDSVSQSGFHVFSVSFDEDRLSEISQAFNGTDFAELLAGREVVTCPASVMRSVRRAVRRFVHSASRDDGPNLLQTTIEVLMLDGTPRPTEPAHTRERAIRRSLEWIDTSGREPVAVSDLCRVAGASRRTLEYAFRERFGVSPKAYLLARRLDGVRRTLRHDPDSRSVTDVAMQWSFHHLSRFAAQYRRQFGELPSETVRAEGSPVPRADRGAE